MAQTSLPPTPTKSGSGPLIGAVIAMLVIGGGFAAWKLREKPAEPTVEAPAPQKQEDNEPELQVAPPPPPPPIETAAPVATASAKEPGAAPKKSAAGPSACGGPCTGTGDASFRAALRQKAGLARGCYNRALRQNSMLQGKMTIAVRVSPSGRVCSARAASDGLGDAAVKSCILQKFRAGTYPKPRGGCVDAQVPLNFVSKQ